VSKLVRAVIETRQKGMGTKTEAAPDEQSCSEAPQQLTEAGPDEVH